MRFFQQLLLSSEHTYQMYFFHEIYIIFHFLHEICSICCKKMNGGLCTEFQTNEWSKQGCIWNANDVIINRCKTQLIIRNYTHTHKILQLTTEWWHCCYYAYFRTVESYPAARRQKKNIRHINPVEHLSDGCTISEEATWFRQLPFAIRSEF